MRFVGVGFVRGIGGRRDKNHGPIRDGLRDCGFSCEDNADAGNGKPDLIVGAYGITFLLEVKSEKGKESAEQEAKRKAWKGGPWLVVYTLGEAIKEIWKHRG